MSKNKFLSIIVKPTNECNFSCKYCYVEDKNFSDKMEIDLFDESMNKISKFSQKSFWIWHGGEPLLMGSDFFKEIKEIQKFYEQKNNHLSENGIQTNGSLIDNDLIDLIKRTNDFQIGLSLDGPKKINDKTRIFSTGEGTFNRIKEKMDLMKERKIEFGTICVVNKNHLQKENELYEFFSTNGINIKLNPLIKTGEAINHTEEIGITPKEYSLFMGHLFDIYNKDSIKNNGIKIRIDPILESISNVIFNQSIGCRYLKSCRESFISINPFGDIYPCGRFDGEKSFLMGNIKKDSIEKILDSKPNSLLKKRNLELITSDCGKCNFEEICNGGCMHNAYSEGDFLKKDPYCPAYKNLYNKSNLLVEEELKKNE